MPDTKQKRRVEEPYHRVKEAFLAFWDNTALPLDLRFYICGAVYQGGVKQGDEVFPREYFLQLMMDAPLDPVQIEDMLNKVNHFVKTDKLRVQYLYIVVHMATAFVARAAQQAAWEVAREDGHIIDAKELTDG
jgi:hypothetical protein